MAQNSLIGRANLGDILTWYRIYVSYNLELLDF